MLAAVDFVKTPAKVTPTKAAPSLALRLLGPPPVLRDGVAVAQPWSRKVRALRAFRFDRATMQLFRRTARGIGFDR